MADASKVQKALVVERDAAVNHLRFAEAKIQELEARLEQECRELVNQLMFAETKVQELKTRLERESRESSDMGVLRQRISAEMDDERKQYQKELAERDFTADQTRKKYQGIS